MQLFIIDFTYKLQIINYDFNLVKFNTLNRTSQYRK